MWATASRYLVCRTTTFGTCYFVSNACNFMRRCAAVDGGAVLSNKPAKRHFLLEIRFKLFFTEKYLGVTSYAMVRLEGKLMFIRLEMYSDLIVLMRATYFLGAGYGLCTKATISCSASSFIWNWREMFWRVWIAFFSHDQHNLLCWVRIIDPQILQWEMIVHFFSGLRYLT